jgi:hypothetical protein
MLLKDNPQWFAATHKVNGSPWFALKLYGYEVAVYNVERKSSWYVTRELAREQLILGPRVEGKEANELISKEFNHALQGAWRHITKAV